MSLLAVVGSESGVVEEPPGGRPCAGCRQAVGAEEHGYLLRGWRRRPRAEVWHQACFLDAAELTHAADWVQSRPYLSVVEEKERIARELRGGVIRSLSGIRLELRATARLAGNRLIDDQVEEWVTELDRCISRVRGRVVDIANRTGTAD